MQARCERPSYFSTAETIEEPPFQQIEQFAVQAEIEGKWFDYRIFEAEPHGWHRWRPASLRVVLEASNALFERYLRGRNREIRLTRNR